MDEYKVGQIVVFDGKPYEYQGGPVAKKSSWKEVQPQTSERDEAQLRLASGGGNAFSDFARMVAQGATFGTADEMVGVAKGPAARAQSRQRVDDLRLLAPGASMASEIAGGAALPAGAGARLGAGIAAKTGSRALGGILGGGAAGAAGAAAMGAGEAQGSPMERIADAAPDMVPGGLFGGLLGAAGVGAGRALERTAGRPSEGVLSEASDLRARRALSRGLEEGGVPPGEVLPRTRALGDDAVVADLAPNLAREGRAALNQAPSLTGPRGPVLNLRDRFENRGEALASTLRDGSGLEGTFKGSLEAAEEGVQIVRRDFYRPLEDAFPSVDGPNVREALSHPRVRSLLDEYAPGAARGQSMMEELAGMGVPAEQARALAGGKGPSFQELQDILITLREAANPGPSVVVKPGRMAKAREAYQIVQEAMTQDVPGFREAQKAYALAQARVSAHEMGRKAIGAGRPAREIMDEISELPTPEAKDAYRTGILDAYEVKLRQRETGGGAATGLMAAGQEVQQKLRVLADSDDGFRRMLDGIERQDLYSRTWGALSGNSTTAQQVSDMLSQAAPDVSPDKQWVFRKILTSLVGLSEKERRAAAETLGRALMTDGEEAARLLAQEMSLMATLGRGTPPTGFAALAGAAGGAGGTAAGGYNR